MSMLPPEIIQIIVYHLQSKDKYAFMQCCWRFHAIVGNDPEYLFCKQIINNKLFVIQFISRLRKNILRSPFAVNRKLSRYDTILHINFTNMYSDYYILNVGINQYPICRHEYTWRIQDEYGNQRTNHLKRSIQSACQYNSDVEKIYKLITNFLDEAFNVPTFKK